MLRPRLLILTALAFALASGAHAAPADTATRPPDETLAYLDGLPETNPYRAILLRLHTLPAADREALENWADGGSGDDAPAPALTSEQQALAREFSADLVSLAARPTARAEDWPVLRDPTDPDNPAAMTIPGVGLARRLARLAVKTGDTLPPGEALAIYAAAAQFGRQQRTGATLIEQLTGVAIEGVAFSAAGRRLAEFSPAELQSLSAAWASLQPGPGLAEAFVGERDLFFAPIVDKFIRPGLVALLAETSGPDGQGTVSAPDKDPDAGFTRHLRLSGLADLGDGERRISLEDTRAGNTFTISEGKSTDGITLVKLDFKIREAVIRRGTCEAVIHLESKLIVERRDESREAIARLRKFICGTGMIPDEETETLLNTLLKRARRHPGGANGYADDLLATYQRMIDTQVAAAASPDVTPDALVPPPSDDPFVKLIVPTLGKVARTLTNSATSATMLQAAIYHRLAQLGAATSAATPADPWTPDGAPFGFTPTPDGGFTLSSRYEVKPDHPLTYKFAAPDAGLVRPK